MGPLQGFKVIEIDGIGPCPFGGMLLADLGAEVIRVGKPEPSALEASFDLLGRGKKSVTLDLKKRVGVEALLELIRSADALIEGFRPGVMERLGAGPDVCLEVNPRLVFGRMTGWGQNGPLAQRAAHDINYLSLTGALHAIGRPGQPPTVPLNLLGDFGGGGFVLAFGVVAALLETQKSGRGQVVDASMVDGVAALMATTYVGMQTGFFCEARGRNLLDGGAPFYDVYETSDGKYVSVGALEPKFYAELLEKLGLQDEAPAPGEHLQPATWNALRRALEARFRTKTRDHWCELFEGSDACVAPVLATAEVFEHSHHVTRESFVEIDGIRQARPVPRFSRTPARDPRPGSPRGADNDEVFRAHGIGRTS